MKSYKRTIIRKYGTNVSVARWRNGELQGEEELTKALLGRSTRTNTNLEKSESQRTCIFLPEFEMDSGYFITNAKHNEVYVTVSTHQEYDGDGTLSIVTNSMKCNNHMTIERDGQFADDRGNLVKGFIKVVEDLPCYFEHVSSQLRQFMAGLNADTEYIMYTTAVGIQLDDKISITSNGEVAQYKVTALDYTSFPNLVVIEVESDIR